MNFCSGAWDVLCGSSLWWVEGWQQENKPDTYHGTGKLWRRVSDPFFFPAASSLTQHLVVESLMLPVVPQTTSYKPLPAFVEGSTPGILKKATIFTRFCKKSGFVSTQIPIMDQNVPYRGRRAFSTTWDWIPYDTLSLSHAHQPESQFACCICSHCFLSGLFREEKVTL